MNYTKDTNKERARTPAAKAKDTLIAEKRAKIIKEAELVSISKDDLDNAPSFAELLETPEAKALADSKMQ